MVSLSAFLFAVMALVLAPGPTNALMGLAGARHGMVRATGLIPAVIGGYVLVAIPAAWAGSSLLERWPTASQLLPIAAAIWLLFLATCLWRSTSDSQAVASITARKMLVTTALNPKAMIVGITLLPAFGTSGFFARLALFVLAVTAAALVWGAAGSLAHRGENRPRLQRLLQQAASVWLAIVSLSLFAGLLRA
ncbi:MAG: LysE family transporter [Novosphingobium sp.]